MLSRCSRVRAAIQSMIASSAVAHCCCCFRQGGRTGVANAELRSMEQCKMPWGAKLHGVNGSWSFCSPLCRPRTALGACAVRDRIYAVGGQVGTLRRLLQLMLQ